MRTMNFYQMCMHLCCCCCSSMMTCVNRVKLKLSIDNNYIKRQTHEKISIYHRIALQLAD